MIAQASHREGWRPAPETPAFTPAAEAIGTDAAAPRTWAASVGRQIHRLIAAWYARAVGGAHMNLQEAIALHVLRDLAPEAMPNIALEALRPDPSEPVGRDH